MKKRDGLSEEEHRKLGKRLSQLHNELVDLQVTLGNRMGLKYGDMVGAVDARLSKLRSKLDDQVDSNDIYYPKYPYPSRT